MKAAPALQRRLLDVQALDTALNQLAHRRDHLPEIARLQELGAQAQHVRARRDEISGQLAEIDRQIRALEVEVEQVRGRADRDRARMDAGTVNSAKELESLAHEVATLSAKQAELEDTELALMERQEQAAAAVHAVEAELAEIDQNATQASLARDEQWSAIDAQRLESEQQRAGIVAELPTDLVTLYEKIRADGRVGAALLRGRRCEGCRIELSGTELAEAVAAAEDNVVRHEECRAILVRTGESGL